MSTVPSLPARSGLHDPVGLPARPRLSVGKIVALAIVILIGIGVGMVLAVFIALLSGWIPIC